MKNISNPFYENKIVGITHYEGNLYVATEKAIFILNKELDKFVPVKLEQVEE